MRNQLLSRAPSRSENADRILMLPTDQIGIWGFGFVRGPLFVDSCSAFSFRRLCALSAFGRADASNLRCFDCAGGSDCTGEGVPQAQTEARAIVNGDWIGFHFLRRLVWRPPALAFDRSCHYPRWQCVHDRSVQNQSHILPRLQLQPLRSRGSLISRTACCEG
jgi:hypothetical protein